MEMETPLEPKSAGRFGRSRPSVVFMDEAEKKEETIFNVAQGDGQP
jgi:hypothetical protein